MNLPFEYDRLAAGEFGGTTPTPTDFEHARVVILPVPLDRTTSYVAGTRNGPHEILVASSHMELWDEETRDRRPQRRHLHAAGDGVSVRDDGRGDAGDPAGCHRRSSSRDKFPVVLGGEHSITAPVVAAMAVEAPGAVGAADRRACGPARVVHGHAAQPRLRHAPRARPRAHDQVGIRSLSPEEAAAAPALPTDDLLRLQHAADDDWIERIVDSLGETVYITIDCDGLDPAIMPAVGTPEPGGLTWYETLALLRRVIESRRVVGCDLVELCPLPGIVAPELPLRQADLQDPVVPVWG